MLKVFISCAATVVLGLSLQSNCQGVDASSPRFSWQQQHAKVLPTGDLEWAPRPFVFEKGDSVRYVDFDAGSDDNDGISKDKPWKHHPWDSQAQGKAKECKGIHTYVFKCGVIYRGKLIAAESGEPGKLIRLTSDPAWGKGEAMIYGSEKVTGWAKGGHEKTPEKDKVWHADLPFAPRLVCMVDKDGKILRLNLARTPNWKVTDPDDVLGNCWAWENPEWWKDRNKYKTTVGKSKMHLGMDKKHLTGSDDYYIGALVWSEWGIMMGTPYAAPVEAFDAGKKTFAFQGPWNSDSGEGIFTNHRYWLEDKPHYLDEAGEFWFEKKGEGGTLYVRLPGDTAPATVTVEAARHSTLIDSKGMSHVDISGLSFRFGNIFWDLASRPFGGDVETAGVRLVGSGTDIAVRNCRFEYMAKGIRLKAPGKDARIDNVRILDNEISFTDHGAIEVLDGTGWAQKDKPASLGTVQILRNSLHEIGFRPYRPNGTHALHVNNPERAEIAGNFIERCGGSGLFIFGGKASDALYDAPFTNILIHHNKVTDPLLISNDWGGIETWQGGPFYVYNNISGNPGGLMNWGGKRFGHAYYLDGSFKNYHFNNIAWGKNNDPKENRKANTAAFQEIISYQNTFFNNTAYKFLNGSRRQAPQAGRDKFLGNIFQDISYMVFRHSDAEGKDPNARDAGAKIDTFAYDTDAYSRNVFFDLTGKMGVFEAQGGDYSDLASFAKALSEKKALASDVGLISEKTPLQDAPKHDFRPSPGSAAIGTGVKVFAPWSLYATVGEWHFTVDNADPTTVIDEHWYMKPHMVSRDDYWKSPMYPLKAVNVTAGDFVAGPLEDWTNGALNLNGSTQYLFQKNVEQAKAPEIKTKEVKEKWFTATAPAACAPGVPCELKLNLLEIPADSMLVVDINCLKGNSFGGWLKNAGRQKVDGTGPYVFKIDPPESSGVTKYVLTVYAAPGGDWGKKVNSASIEIEKVDTPVNFDPQVNKSNFLIEAYFKTEPGAKGVLVEKIGSVGHSLSINDKGLAEFAILSLEGRKAVATSKVLNDGKWHHLIAESDRKAKTLTLYVDGLKDVSGSGVGETSLANDSELHVGGTPKGRCLAATFDFLRISHGTLDDAKTTIDELYAWEFDGPQFRDFTARKPSSKRAAGALDYIADK
jgi:hypothetical protein